MKWSAKVSSLVLFFLFNSGGPKVPWPDHIRPVEGPSVPGSDLEYLSPSKTHQTARVCATCWSCWSCWSCISDGLQWPQRDRISGFLSIHRGLNSEHWTCVCPWSVRDPYRLLKFGWYFQPQVHVSHLMDRGRMQDLSCLKTHRCCDLFLDSIWK